MSGCDKVKALIYKRTVTRLDSFVFKIFVRLEGIKLLELSPLCENITTKVTIEYANTLQNTVSFVFAIAFPNTSYLVRTTNDCNVEKYLCYTNARYTYY